MTVVGPAGDRVGKLRHSIEVDGCISTATSCAVNSEQYERISGFSPASSARRKLRCQQLRWQLQQSVNTFEVEDVHMLSLPPTKAEQEAIAEALSDADALIESLEQLIAKKRHLKQGAMQELLTGKKRLPGSGRVGREATRRACRNSQRMAALRRQHST